MRNESEGSRNSTVPYLLQFIVGYASPTMLLSIAAAANPCFFRPPLLSMLALCSVRGITQELSKHTNTNSSAAAAESPVRNPNKRHPTGPSPAQRRSTAFSLSAHSRHDKTDRCRLVLRKDLVVASSAGLRTHPCVPHLQYSKYACHT